MLNTRTTQRFEALAVALAGMTSFVVWLSAALAILYVLGVRLGLLLTGAGLIGVALGFGAQSLIRDVLSGVFILIEDQFGVGDEVDLGVAIGSVEAVTLRATTLRSVDGTVWHVPNGQIQRAGNMSQHWSRALLDVQIALDSDIDRARAAMKRVADEVWHENNAIIEEPQVWGGTEPGTGWDHDPAGGEDQAARAVADQSAVARAAQGRVRPRRDRGSAADTMDRAERPGGPR